MSGMTNKVLTQDWKDIPEISNMILSRDTTVGLIDQRTSADFEELEVTPFLNLIAKEDVADAKKVLRDITKNIMPEKDLEFKLITSGGEKFDGNPSQARTIGPA